MTIKAFSDHFKISKSLAISLLLVCFYLFLRFYKIQDSLLFFNDIGRDFLALHNWLISGKPPLLGPQTSVIPFNQSALYFYLLMPFYLLTNKSIYATLIANAFFYIATFLLGIILLKKHPKLQSSLLLIFSLLTIHPQQIIQSRFVWNPSFVTPCIITAFYFLILFKKNFNPKLLYWLSFSLALASAFSYSAVPVILSFVILFALAYRAYFFKFIKYLCLNLALLNFPTIIFELRHNFLLTKMMLYQEKLSQSDFDLPTKLDKLRLYLFDFDFKYVLLIILILLAYLFRRNFKIKSNYVLAFIILTLTFSLSLILPIGIASHYIFGILALLFVTIAFLPFKFSIIVLLILSLNYLNSNQLASYFKPAYRSVNETIDCVQSVCSQYKRPTFVSVQSDIHPYHNGMEFKYLFSRYGCDIKELDSQIDQSSHMLVVVDHSTYEHGKTAYNELTQFGDSKQIDIFTCSKDLKIIVLEKN